MEFFLGCFINPSTWTWWPPKRSAASTSCVVVIGAVRETTEMTGGEKEIHKGITKTADLHNKMKGNLSPLKGHGKEQPRDLKLTTPELLDKYNLPDLELMGC